MSETHVAQMMRDIKEDLQPAGPVPPRESSEPCGALSRVQRVRKAEEVQESKSGCPGRTPVPHPTTWLHLAGSLERHGLEGQAPDLSLMIRKDAFPFSGAAHVLCSLSLTLLPTLPFAGKAQAPVRRQSRIHRLALGMQVKREETGK